MLASTQLGALRLRPSPIVTCTASTTGRPCLSAWPVRSTALLHHSRRHSRPVPCAASNSSSSNGDSPFAGAGQAFAGQAQAFAETVQKKVGEFVTEQKLEEKAAQASKDAQRALSSTVQELQEGARRTYMKLDSEYDLQGKADSASKRVQEATADIDQQWGVRRRIRAAAADVRQRLPTWKRKIGAFSATQEGKAAALVLFVVLLSTGALWSVLNLAWLLWWVSLPVGFLMADQARKEAATAAATAESEQRKREQQSPFASFFGGRGRGAGDSSARRGGSSGGRVYADQDGPVVDAQWVSLDDDGSYKRR